MTEISDVIEGIATTPYCFVHPVRGVPAVSESNRRLPDDVLEFYALCGGVELYSESDYSIEIVGPDQIKPANQRFFRGLREDQIATAAGHPCWDWYIIAKALNTEYVVIDLHPERLGICYDASWETYPAPDAVIARSFSDLLRRLYENGGEYFYWLENGYDPA